MGSHIPKPVACLRRFEPHPPVYWCPDGHPDDVRTLFLLHFPPSKSDLQVFMVITTRSYEGLVFVVRRNILKISENY